MARVSFLERAKQVAVALGWIVAFVVVGGVVSIILNSLNPVGSDSPWALAANSGGLAIGFLVATWVVGRLLTQRSWDRMGWHAQGGGGLGGRIGRGAALGAAMAALAIGFAFVGSGATVQLTHDWSSWVERAGPLAGALLVAALWEELTFRGLPLRLLADALGPVAAMLLLAGGFGLTHAGNPHVPVLGMANVALAGVWLSFAFFSPGGMALAWGLHFGWNAGLALLFDAPVSGYGFQVPAVEYLPGARAWVDGGAFGPEGGLVATIVLLAGTLALVGGRLRQPSAWFA